MTPVFLIVFVNVMVHACFLGSRVAVALFAIELGASPLMIGVMVGLYSVPPLFLGVYAGRMSDRYGMRPPLLLGSCLICLGFILPYLWPSLSALYVSAAVIGTGFVFFMSTVQNFVGACGPREERARNFSTLSLSYSISTLVGPLVAGYSIEYLNHANTYLVFSLSVLVALLILFLSRKFLDIETPQDPEGKKSLLDLLRIPELRKVLFMGAMVVAGWDLYLFYLPIYAHSLGLSASKIGIVLGVFASATFIVRVGIPRLTKRFTSRRVLAAAMFGGAAMFILFPFVKDVLLLGVLSFAIGLALGCGQPLTLLLCYNRSPEGRTGEVTGIRLSLNHFTHSTIPIAAGGLGGVFGVAPVFIMIALILFASSYVATTVTPMLKSPSGAQGNL